ncbi:MAG: hypothetical protein LBQ88_05265 [Treponema sp.]|nr:hypothetical protein [Treponema sp.]
MVFRQSERLSNCRRVDFDEVKKAITLISANPSYLPHGIAGKDIENVKIEGRVIACLHRM